MDSARAGLTAKQPGAGEDEAAGWNVTSQRSAQLPGNHRRAWAPGS
jgi:hypothetical protein